MSCNAHITRRNHEVRYAVHRRNLRNMKSSIDNSPPKRISHLKYNATRKRTARERTRKIERDNKLLLNKMGDILRTKTLDNRNKSRKYRTSKFHTQRRKEMLKITDDNQKILARLRSIKSQYSSKKLDADFRRSRKLVNRISFYGDPKSPKQKNRVLDLSRSSARRLLRPVTAPLKSSSASSRANVRRNLMFTDTRAFGDGVWEVNVWDASGGTRIKESSHIVRVTAEHTTTGTRCGTQIDYERLKAVCEDSALLKRVFTDEKAPQKTFSEILGGCDSLLTMQLGLHIVALIKIEQSKKSGAFKILL